MTPKTMYEDYKANRASVINGIYRDSKINKIYEIVDVHPAQRSGYNREDAFEAIPCNPELNRLSDEPYTPENVPTLRHEELLETILLRETVDFVRIASRINAPETVESE